MQNDLVTSLLNDLVRSSDTANKLALVDQQLKVRTISGDSYIVPENHQWMAPLIEAFWDKPKDWLEFIREISHRFPKRSEMSIEIRKVKRRINTRVDAIIRREREKRLVHSYERIYGPFDSASQKDAYVKWVSSQWHERRDAIRTKLRSQTIGPVDADELYEVYSDLWFEIDSEIEDGSIPLLESNEYELIPLQNLNHQALLTLACEARIKAVELAVAIIEYEEECAIEAACYPKAIEAVTSLREIEAFLKEFTIR
jgi:hypothetical protein